MKVGDYINLISIENDTDLDNYVYVVDQNNAEIALERPVGPPSRWQRCIGSLPARHLMRDIDSLMGIREDTKRANDRRGFALAYLNGFVRDLHATYGNKIADLCVKEANLDGRKSLSQRTVREIIGAAQRRVTQSSEANSAIFETFFDTSSVGNETGIGTLYASLVETTNSKSRCDSTAGWGDLGDLAENFIVAYIKKRCCPLSRNGRENPERHELEAAAVEAISLHLLMVNTASMSEDNRNAAHSEAAACDSVTCMRSVIKNAIDNSATLATTYSSEAVAAFSHSDSLIGRVGRNAAQMSERAQAPIEIEFSSPILEDVAAEFEGINGNVGVLEWKSLSASSRREDVGNVRQSDRDEIFARGIAKNRIPKSEIEDALSLVLNGASPHATTKLGAIKPDGESQQALSANGLLPGENPTSVAADASGADALNNFSPDLDSSGRGGPSQERLEDVDLDLDDARSVPLASKGDRDGSAEVVSPEKFPTLPEKSKRGYFEGAENSEIEDRRDQVSMVSGSVMKKSVEAKKTQSNLYDLEQPPPKSRLSDDGEKFVDKNESDEIEARIPVDVPTPVRQHVQVAFDALFSRETSDRNPVLWEKYLGVRASDFVNAYMAAGTQGGANQKNPITTGELVKRASEVLICYKKLIDLPSISLEKLDALLEEAVAKISAGQTFDEAQSAMLASYTSALLDPSNKDSVLSRVAMKVAGNSASNTPIASGVLESLARRMGNVILGSSEKLHDILNVSDDLNAIFEALPDFLEEKIEEALKGHYKAIAQMKKQLIQPNQRAILGAIAGKRCMDEKQVASFLQFSQLIEQRVGAFSNSVVTGRFETAIGSLQNWFSAFESYMEIWADKDTAIYDGTSFSDDETKIALMGEFFEYAAAMNWRVTSQSVYGSLTSRKGHQLLEGLNALLSDQANASAAPNKLKVAGWKRVYEDLLRVLKPPVTGNEQLPIGAPGIRFTNTELNEVITAANRFLSKEKAEID